MDRKLLIKLGRLVFCLGIVLSTFLESKGQNISYTSNALSVDIFIINPCSGNNGAIKFTINSTTGGANAQIAILGSPVNLFPSQSVPSGTTFVFNAAHTLKPGSYSWIIGDGTETIGSLSDPSTYPALVLTTITSPTVSKDLEVNNSSCSSPNGAVQGSISGGSKALAGGGSFKYTWTSNNGLSGLPLTGTTDGTTPLNLATLLSLGGLPGGQYTLAVSDNYSFCSAANTVFNITDPSPAAQTVNPTGTINVCSNSSAPISLQGSEAFPVVYHILKNGVDTGVSQNGTGSPLTLTLPNGSFSNGDVLTVLATNQLCTPTLMIGSVTINIVPVPSITNVTNVNVTCNGGNDGSLKVTASGGTGALTYVLNPGAVSNGTGAFSGLIAGAYTVTVTDVNNCSPPVANITITEPPAITITSSGGTDITCNGLNDGKITVVAAGGTGALTYTLNPGAISNTTGSFTNLSGNTYTVTVVDSKGCGPVVTPNIVIANPPVISISSTTNINVTCNGGNDGKITVVAAGGTGMLTYTLSPGAINNTTGVFPTLLAGTYSVSVTDVNGCPAAVSSGIVVTEPALVTITSSSSTNVTTCNGGNNGSITVAASGGTGTLTYTLNPGAISNTTGSFITLTANTYTVSVTDTKGCGPATTASIVITQPPLITITSTASTNATCNAKNDGTITVAASGGTGALTYTVNPGAISNSTGAFTNLSANTYTVSVTDVNGCGPFTTPNIVITDPTAISITSTSSVDASCNGKNDGSVTVAASGGTGTLTYTLNPGAISNTTGSFLNLLANSYTVSVTDINGCGPVTTASIMVNQPTAISITSTGSVDASCNGKNDGSVTVVASGGTGALTYTLNPGAISNATGSFLNLLANSYTVTITDANTCNITTSSIVVNQPTVISITSTGSVDASCNGKNDGSVTVVASGGTGALTYTLNPGAISNATGSFPNLLANTYTVTITDANTCNITTASIVVNQPTAISITSTGSTDATCNGKNDGSVTVAASGGTGTLTYTLNPGAISNTTGSFINLLANSYTVGVTDVNNCGPVTTASIVVSQPTAISITSTGSVDASCNGKNDGSVTVVASGGTGALTYTLNPGAISNTTGSFLNLLANSYTVTITDANTCNITTSSIVVNQPATISITSTGSVDATCNGKNDGSVTVAASGGTGALTYTLNPGAISNATGSFPNLLANTYAVTITDANTCNITTASIVVNQPTAISITSTGSTNATCNAKNDGTITVAASGGTGTLTYTLSPGGTTNTTGSFINLSANTYTVSVDDTKNCGPVTTANIIITDPTAISITSTGSVDASCNGKNDGAVTVAASGGTGTLTYTLNPGAISNTTGSFLNLLANTYTVSITDANSCGPVITSSIVVNQPTAISITSTSSTNATCNAKNDGTVTVAASGGTGTLTYTLNPGATSNTTGSFPNLVANTYTVTITDANNCSITTASIVITQPPPVTAAISGSTNICNGTSANLTVAFGGAPVSTTWTFVYTDGTTNSAAIPSFFSSINFPVNPSTTTTYSLVSVVDNKGCTGTVSGSATVTVSPTPGDQVTFGTDTWLGYVYNDAANPAPPVSNIDFASSRYRGFIDETDIASLGFSTYNTGTDVFDFNLSNSVPVSGPNLCGTYLDDFSIHYKMRKTFAAGVYTFTAGADDGVRLLVDGVNIINSAAFGTHAYQTFSGTVCLTAGSHDLEIQYFEHTGFSRLTFDYQVAPAPTVTSPVSLCVNSAEPTLTATSPDPSVTGFNWYSDAGLTTLISSGGSFTPTPAELDMTTVASTSFFVTAVYACAESQPATVTVNVINSATITLPTPPVQVCKTGGTVDLTTLVSAVPSGGSFTFAGTGVSTSPTFDPTLVATSPTTITVDYSSGSCVAPTQTFNIDVINSASITVPSSPVNICQSSGLQDLTALVSATPIGGTFTFSSVSPGVSGTKYDPSAGSGTVTIKVDYAVGGCTDSKTFNFNVTPSASLTTSNKTVCAASGNVNLTTLVSGTPAGGVFAFSGTSVSGNSFDPSTHAGNTITVSVLYTVSGCSSASGTLQINVLNASDPICTGGGTGTCASVIIDPQPTAATCALSTGSITFNVTPQVPLVNNTGVKIDITGPVNDTKFNSFVFTNLPAGIYSYSIEYGDPSCIKTGSVTIDKSGTVGTPVASNIVPPTCFGDSTGSAIITITQPVDITGQALQWSLTPAIASSWKNFTAGGVITGIPAGLSPTFQQIISIRKDASDLCYAGVTIVMPNGNPRIKSTFAITAATCGGNDGAIKTITASGGAGGAYSYSIDGVNFQSANNFSNIAGGLYTLSIKDNIGCVKDTTASVTFPGFVAFNTTAINADCSNNGKSGKIVVLFTNPGNYRVGISQDPLVEPKAYRDDPFDGLSFTFDSLSRGTYYIFAKGTGAACPTKSAAITINGIFAIDFKIQPVCVNNEVSIVLSNVTGQQGVVFDLTVYDKIGNKVVDPAAITPLPPLDATQSYFLSADNPDYTFLKTPGEYKIQLDQLDLSTFCIIYSDLMDYQVYPPLVAFVGATTKSYPDIPNGTLQVINITGGLVPYEIKIKLDSAAVPGFDYETDYVTVPKNNNLKYEMDYKELPPGRYVVDVTDTLGCTIEIIGRIPLDNSIFIPNIFTPNGDSLNDTFFIRNLPVGGTNIIISNRWGKEIYSSKDYKNNWDGGGVSDGVYFYRLQVEGSSALTGWVEIIRGDKP